MLAEEVTYPDTCLPFSVVTHTSVSFGISGRSRTPCRSSKLFFCFCFISLFALQKCRRYCHCGTSADAICGIFDWICLPVSNSAGDRPHHDKGVERYESNAMCGSFVFLSSFHGSFCMSITLRKMGAAGCVLETVLLSKFAELL